MDYELKFTSAEAGVKRSAQGFCTVFATAGMPPTLLDRLESLSVYRHLFPAGQPGEERNPVSVSHLVVPVFGETFHVVSRVQSAGLDYSKRYNYFAHHRVIDAANLPSTGPAWLASQGSVLQPHWDGQVATPKSVPPIPPGRVLPGVARRWQALTGDAGWAGWILQQWHVDPDKEIAIVFTPGDPTLELVQECVALLPPAARWRLTFSTFATKLPPDVGCALRFVAAGTPESARPNAAHVLDLRALRGKSPPAGHWADAARQGREVPIPGIAAQEIDVEDLSPALTAMPSLPGGYAIADDLSPLPPPPRRRRLADVTELPTPPTQSRVNWVAALVSLVALFMFGVAGWMVWDGKKRAAELALREMEEGEREQARLHAEAEAERTFQERRKKADAETARNEAIERERQEKAKKESESKEKEDRARLQRAQEKAKEQAATAKRKTEDELAKKKADAEKTKSAEQKPTAPADLPEVRYVDEEVRDLNSVPGGAARRSQPLVRMDLAPSGIGLYGNVLKSFDVKKAKSPTELLVLKKGSTEELANISVVDKAIVFSWSANSRDSSDSLRARLKESVLVAELPAPNRRIVIALRKAPTSQGPLPCAWIIDRSDRDTTTNNRDRSEPKQPDEGIRNRWKTEVPEETDLRFKIELHGEVGLDGTVLDRSFKFNSKTKDGSFQSQWKLGDGFSLHANLELSKTVGMRLRWLPLIIRFDPTGQSLKEKRAEATSKCEKLRGKAQPLRVQIRRLQRELGPGPTAKPQELIDLEKQLAPIQQEIDERNADIEHARVSLARIEEMAKRMFVGAIYFEVDAKGEKIKINVVEFGDPTTLKPKDGK